ncbi:hypothetical protein N7499_004562 [Penicillium canescens]|nr:hypothetical protein N7522_005051 [Penicillium canescens]KAJ6084933.1 hypothetical protein N7499_004562 [Penicillium canescens]KAJ6161719.1 hypothetical protein N7485_009949 [Penicillium canescens]
MFGKDIASSELRLDQSCIFVQEGRHEELSPSITGRFSLSLAQPATFKSIQVRLRGILSIPIEGFLGPEIREQLTFDRQQALATTKTLNAFQMPAGEHEFLFSIPIPSKMFSTVISSNRQYHKYKVEVVIERRLKSDFVVSQPIHVYQLCGLEQSYLRPYNPLTLERQSDQNIQYCISLADRNIPFGCTFPVECWFAPLSKGTKLNAVTVKVQERQSVRLDATAAESVRQNIHFVTCAHNHTVFSKKIDFADGNEPTGADSMETEWRINTSVCLPRTLGGCSQSLSTKHIKIKHVLSIKAEFCDEEGQVTAEISEVIPIEIYMTPCVIGENGFIHGRDIQQLQGDDHPPPAYNDHLSDLIILTAADVDLCGSTIVTEMNIERSSSQSSSSRSSYDPAPLYV